MGRAAHTGRFLGTGFGRGATAGRGWACCTTVVWTQPESRIAVPVSA